MEEDLVTPRRAVTMVGLPGMVQKKAEQSNVPLPGVLRNSGGKKDCLYKRTERFLFKYCFCFAKATSFQTFRFLCSLSLSLIYRRPS